MDVLVSLVSLFLRKHFEVTELNFIHCSIKQQKRQVLVNLCIQKHQEKACHVILDLQMNNILLTMYGALDCSTL